MKYQKTLFQHCLAIAFSGLMLTSCGGGEGEGGQSRNENAATELPQTAGPESPVLVPGASAGAFKLDEPDSLILRQLGQPDYSDAAMGKAVLLWYTDTAEGHPLSIFTARDMGNDETARIQQIRVTSPVFETAESIHVGSTLTGIRDHYQLTPVETYEKEGETYSVYRSDRGIAFEVGSDDSCTAIIIHHAGADVATYLPLRPAE